MREEFMKRIDARQESENNKKAKFDIAAQPFGAEEMLLKKEIELLEEEKLLGIRKGWQR